MRVLFIPSLFAVGMMGCLAESEGLDEGVNSGIDEGPASSDALLTPPPLVADEDAAPEQGILGELPRLGPTYTEGALAPHGGGGGHFTGHVTPAAVIYAVRVRSGAYVDAIAFAWYQPSGFDNYYRSGDPWGATSLYGGSGGVDRGWWYCPGGQSVIGIRGSAGAYVDRVGVICGNVTNPDPYSPYNTYSPLWGGSGGGWFDDRCGGGRLVDSFNVRSGAYVDNLQAICINAH
jgi:hypothetical protein